MKVLAVGDLVGNSRNKRTKKTIRQNKRRRKNRFYNSKCRKFGRGHGYNPSKL